MYCIISGPRADFDKTSICTPACWYFFMCACVGSIYAFMHAWSRACIRMDMHVPAFLHMHLYVVVYTYICIPQVVRRIARIQQQE